MFFERSPLDEAQKAIQKEEVLKVLIANTFFNIQSKTHKKFVTGKQVNHPHISINEKNLLDFALKRNAY